MPFVSRSALSQKPKNPENSMIFHCFSSFFEQKIEDFLQNLIENPSNFWYFQKFQILNFEKIFFKNVFFTKILFFIKTMLIRFSLPSSNPITLLDTIHPLSDTEPKIGKSWKVENPDIGRSAPPHTCPSYM